jgi:hypothetical protein
MGNAQQGSQHSSRRQASESAFDRAEAGETFEPYSDSPSKEDDSWFGSAESAIRRHLGSESAKAKPSPEKNKEPESFTSGIFSGASNLVRKVSGAGTEAPAKSAGSSESTWARMPFGGGEIADAAATTTENPCPCIELTYKQRVFGFILFFVLGGISSGISTMYVPMIVIKPSKFAIPYTVGNLMSMGSTGFLVGAGRQCKTMFDSTRRQASSVFFVSMFATLYFAFVRKSGIGTIVFVIIQLMAYAWYIASYIPFGRALLKKCTFGLAGCCCAR